MCWRDLEFWPWSDEISRKDREAVTEARRLSRRNRKCVGAWLADRVVLELPPQANDAAASLEGRGDVARASNRAAGRCFAAWKAEMRRQ